KNQYYRDLLTALVKKEVKTRYKNSFLGYLWSILLPLSQALVFFVAFKFIVRIQIENYVLFLVAGLFPWQWFINSTQSSASSFLGNANLIKKTTFPREFIVYANVLNDLIHFLLSLPVILLFLLIYHQQLHLTTLLILPLLLLIQLLMTTGVALIVSSVNVFFRDLERIVMIFISIMFYLTPIVFAESMIPKRLHFLLYANPLSGLIVSYRDLFLQGTVNWSYVGVAALYSLFFFALGRFVFKKLQWRFAEVL
ncbi:MAG: ABC transporter permease, partial [Candidatus Berkelbacteria bacterium]|nr:ABC transporter permease [Candidatus Berkelbacteria bacterium]